MSESEARERILDAAARLIAAKGFAGTTVRDIATAAGLNLAMIHYYFGNKEGLYRAIFEEKVIAIQHILAESALAEGSCREKIERFVRAYARFLCRHSHFARLIQLEMLSGGRTFYEVLSPQIARNYALLRGIIEEGVRRGEFRPVNPELAPISVIGMIAFFMLAQPIVEGVIGIGPHQEDFETRLAEHTINLLTNGLFQPAGAPHDASGQSPE